MDTWEYWANFALGFAFAQFVWFPRVFFPLVFSVPRSLYHVFKRNLFPKSLTRGVMMPVLWALVSAGALAVLVLRVPFFPDILPFAIGTGLACIVWIFILLTAKGRSTLNKAYWDTNMQHARNADLVALYATKALAVYLVWHPQKAKTELQD
jgi:hypothetical protein